MTTVRLADDQLDALADRIAARLNSGQPEADRSGGAGALAR
jgi:hypothetical protein